MIKNLLLLGAVLSTMSTNAQTTVFQENFDTAATRNLWTIGDRDGDAETWEYLNAALNDVPSFTGDAVFSFSWYWDAFTPDNTLTSPAIVLPEDGQLSLSFKVSAGDEDLFEEHYAVYVIPANTEFTGDEIPIFEETLDYAYYDVAKVVNVDLTAYAGQNVQLVFRHYDCEDIFYVAIDDVRVEQNTLATTDFNKEKALVYQDQKLVKINGFKDVQEVRVFDLTGKKVRQVKGQSVDVSALPKGVYIFNFYNEKEVISRKVAIK